MISPDGTLAAYHSDQSGRDEVYLRSFPEPREPTLVSEGRRAIPLLVTGRHTVYYWSTTSSAATSTFMAARVQRDPTTVVLSRDSLFTGNYVPSLGGADSARRSLTDLNAEGESADHCTGGRCERRRERRGF